MRLTDKQAKKLSGTGIWVDYYRGYPSIPDLMIKNNNWRKMHGLPLIRRRGEMSSTTRKKIPKMYEECRNCPNNISGYGKCKIKFDNFYYRKGKNNHCCHCQEEIRKWNLGGLKCQ